MLADLNESAAQMVREAAARVAADLDAVLDADLHSAPAVQIERYGRARLGDLAVAAAEAWRQERARRLEDGLARVDDRLTGDLRAELDAVRDAAAQLLGLALTVPGPAADLRRICDSSTRSQKKRGRPSCWPGRSGATCPARRADAAPGSTCAVRPPA